MKIFVDVRFICKSGIGRYIKEIILNTYKEKGLHYCLAGKKDEIEHFIDEHELDENLISIVSYDAPIYSIREQIEGSKLLFSLRNKFDLFFFPHYNVPYYIPGRSVLTVHDLAHFEFSEMFGKLRSKLAFKILKNAVSKATVIIAVSEYTAKKLSSMFPLQSDKIQMIHEGISKKFTFDCAGDLANLNEKDSSCKYILYVGNKKKIKNLDRLQYAVKLVNERIPVKLLAVGKDFGEINLNHGNVESINGAGDDDLKRYYRSADVFVLPSFAEGFGFTPLESMACGCPVVVSKNGSLPEICSDAAYYVDPYDVKNIADGIYKVLTDEELRGTLIQKGLKRSSSFEWRDTAKKTISIFRKVAEQ